MTASGLLPVAWSASAFWVNEAWSIRPSWNSEWMYFRPSRHSGLFTGVVTLSPLRVSSPSPPLFAPAGG